MTDKQTPPDWVLIKAGKLVEFNAIYTLSTLAFFYASNPIFRALCDMIWKYEPSVDRKLLCAREALKNRTLPDWEGDGKPLYNVVEFEACVRAIELWEEGFGK